VHAAREMQCAGTFHFSKSAMGFSELEAFFSEP